MTELNADQSRAAAEIMRAMSPRSRHLLTGYAGSGKTTLIMSLLKEACEQRKSVVLTAPTHKAVSVLARKAGEAGIDVECRTIQSLLGLRPKIEEERQVFVRDRHAPPVDFDVIIIDECSMLGADLMAHIRRYASRAFVLFVGDPAQLPPVGETESQSFSTRSRSHLETIVRQSADNPVLDAAHEIRRTQGGPIDWSWCRPRKAPPLGVYLPGGRLDAWLRKAFTSPEFDEKPDSFRYLAWTNSRVAEINARVRRWRYGDRIPTPFMPGERALFRAPVMLDDVVLFNNNEEATVHSIGADMFRYGLDPSYRSEGWVAAIPSWRISLRRDGHEGMFDVHLPRDAEALRGSLDRIAAEAAEGDKERWKDLHRLKSSMADMQSVYALTVHKSQGSTMRNVFVDVPDIRRRASDNPLECQQMLYVAATRPTDALVLAGV
ncbi:ATP-dependent DNA helicase [Falsiroseomonas sp. CW058]|uniref:ATP-dependent DNA helicase n=1 Tax=Falsiroseomonas sp. CW058 TaxID=3388664 RepID=UPI003D313445